MFNYPFKGEPVSVSFYEDSPPNSSSRVQTKTETHTLSQLWHKNKNFRTLIILIPLLGVIA